MLIRIHIKDIVCNAEYLLAYAFPNRLKFWNMNIFKNCRVIIIIEKDNKQDNKIKECFGHCLNLYIFFNPVNDFFL